MQANVIGTAELIGKGLKDKPAQWAGDAAMKVATQCGIAVGGIGSYCYEKTPKAKAAVLKSVQTVTCHFDGSLKKETHHATKFAKKGPHVDVWFGVDASNLGDEMKDFLRKSL